MKATVEAGGVLLLKVTPLLGNSCKATADQIVVRWCRRGRERRREMQRGAAREVERCGGAERGAAH